MTSNGQSKELDTVIVEGELLDPPTYDIYTGNHLEMAILERHIGAALDAMPRYGTHGHLRLAGKHTIEDLARAIETYEAATR